MKFNLKAQGGFSLVELMIVVAIIGVLAALAVPRFQTFQAKARQSEVKSNLTHVYTLEQSYFGDHDTYVTLPAQGHGAGNAMACGINPLGFNIQPCDFTKVRYSYSVNVPNAAPTPSLAFGAQGTAPGTRIVPGCAAAGADNWVIDQTKLVGPGTVTAAGVITIAQGSDAVQFCN